MANYGQNWQIRGFASGFSAEDNGTLNGKIVLNVDALAALALPEFKTNDIIVSGTVAGSQMFNHTYEMGGPGFEYLGTTFWGYDYEVYPTGTGAAISRIKFEITVNLTHDELTALYSAFPDTPTTNVTVKLQINSYNSLIGSQSESKSFSMQWRISTPPPSVLSGFVTVNPYQGGLVHNFPYWAKGVTRARVVSYADKIDTTNLCGAQITYFNFVFDGYSYRRVYTVSQNEGREKVEIVSNAVTRQGSLPYYCYIIDSRGNEHLMYSGSAFVYDYFTPTLSAIAVYRCDSAGIQSEDGQYIFVQATGGFASVGGHNSIEMKIRYKPGSGAYGEYTTIQSGVGTVIGDGSISTSSSYVVELQIKDTLLKTYSTEAFVASMHVTISAKDGGHCVGIGMDVSEEADNTFHVNYDTLFHTGKITLGSTTLTETKLQQLLALIGNG